MRCASLPTARIRPPPWMSLRTATTEGSLATMPLPLTYTRVLAVPRSMAKSVEKKPKILSSMHVLSRGGWQGCRPIPANY